MPGLGGNMLPEYHSIDVKKNDVINLKIGGASDVQPEYAQHGDVRVQWTTKGIDIQVVRVDEAATGPIRVTII